MIVVYRAKPAEGISMKEVAGRLASESSVGTWTTLATMKEHIRKLMAKAYIVREDGLVKIAYPLELFELGSLPQLFSSVLGNVYGMRAIKRLKAIDIQFPEKYVKSFPGPNHGLYGVKKILGVEKRPILATVPKPKVGLTTEEYADVTYEIAVGGMDLVKDDENLTSQNFNKFEKRLNAVLKSLEKAEAETGEKKGYLVNVTAPSEEMKRRIKLVADTWNKFIMVDVLCAGPAAVQLARELAGEYGLAIHAHRAFHGAIDRVPDHGVTFFLIAKLFRLAGVDHIHIGTNVGKMEADLKMLRYTQRMITEDEFNPDPGDDEYMPQKWYGLKPVMPVASGGLHPGVLPQLLDFMGTDILIQVGGGVTGHPDGVIAGGKAVRQAIDAYLEDIPLDEYAKTHKELARALEKWGYVRPR
ncbi:MAG: type III ribulose-bisphosphate carboxylase [Thermoprotei archaeon]|nr:MAG: type III ribulose-bisphosphate carboxylase [Thermoprotei archaeon]